VEKQSTIFTGKNFEAIVGMAYPALAEKGVTPVFDEMINQKLLKHNMFAFYLTSKQADNMGMLSDLTFGYYDTAKFKNDIHWNDIKFKYMFGVKLDDVKFNGKSAGLCDSRECLITFDSGTSLMSMPTFATKMLAAAKIPTSSNVTPCSSAQQFGDMTLVIGGKDYTLSNEEWMFPAQQIQLSQGGSQLTKFAKLGPLGPQMMTQIDESAFEDKPESSTLVESEESRSHHTKETPVMACASTIMTMDIAKKMFLVGDVFMRKYYTIFDRENDRVGLAEAVTNDKIAALQNK
jgi:cathepsin D